MLVHQRVIIISLFDNWDLIRMDIDKSEHQVWLYRTSSFLGLLNPLVINHGNGNSTMISPTINLRVILQDLLPPWIQPSWDAGWQQNAGRIWLDRCAKERRTLKSHIRPCCANEGWKLQYVSITLCRTAPFLPKSESLEWSQLKHIWST